jgi:hypothetical protein
VNTVAQLLRRLETGVDPCETPDIHGWARPFVFSDPAALPRRQWVYEPHYIRGFTSLTVAPGGLGKSTLALTEAIAIATGRPLLGISPSERTKVWYWNGEDPQEEIDRRVHAILQHHRIPKEDVEGWLFLGSGRDHELVIAIQDRHGTTVAEPEIEAIVRFARVNQIGVIIIDPFVSTHRVAENDNSALDRVVKSWARVADEAHCAIGIVHHTRKPNGQAITVDDARGASSLLAAARHARTLEAMTLADADRWGIEDNARPAHVRIDTGKANLRPSGKDRTWMKLVGVLLPNGDEVQALEMWQPPADLPPLTSAEKVAVLDALRRPRASSPEGWRKDIQSQEWAGIALIEALGWDALGWPPKQSRQRAAAELQRLVDSGDLEVVNLNCGPKRKSAPFLRPTARPS